ncbi:hypothetical protein HPP92_004300 [Vanilla planifolia]|uniref:Uncharacterized protein n=1 Tax=Vanilla planifolia TaxID=51239 RepID=A0A835RWM0_VANPL|nr:hypothetical protein HPP92_004300 [Vanilla planifolia]
MAAGRVDLSKASRNANRGGGGLVEETTAESQREVADETAPSSIQIEGILLRQERRRTWRWFKPHSPCGQV